MLETSHTDDDLILMERVVLSALLDSQQFEDFSSQLKSEDFSSPAHGKLFEYCSQLHAEQKPISAMFLEKKAQGNPQVLDALALVMQTNPLADLRSYIHAIKEASTKRHLMRLALQIRELCQQDRPTADILDSIERKVYQISLDNVETGFKDMAKVLKDTLKMIAEAKARGNEKLIGLDTGFLKLNELTGGFSPGDLIIIGARPSMGKTSLVLNFAKTTLNHNQGVAIFSIEMGAEQLMMRMLSCYTNLHLHNIKNGNLSEDEWERLTKHTQQIYDKPLYIDDAGLLNIRQARSKLRKLKHEHPEIALAIIDYLQLMRGDGEDSRHEQIAKISRELKILARELNIPIIALSQLNRLLESREDKRPILSDLKESGAIEQDADQVLFLYRDAVYKHREHNDRVAKLRKEGKVEEAKNLEKKFNALQDSLRYEKEQAEIILAKNRNGGTGTVKVHFDKIYTRFSDIPKEGEEPQGDQTPTNINMGDGMPSNFNMPNPIDGGWGDDCPF
ncbi:Replicative DNA helicase DnaB [Helicobacter sp. NHP19-012]|uniref:Replicative DNA helicase n=1 Tax=Helicobacter gastrofelis TaxID=2849642 RepID=A0ABN6I791_9HELI|nr:MULTISPECIES: replicative DNA helicase [unclassified Helicobacter]BCZ18479.1 Replicative DNA helicase DnaB [Helicobacter sp. NHP19-012]GMB95755.1 Replicative DNA helicase DnaB [Helicobacter sp. NHP22-001]